VVILNHSQADFHRSLVDGWNHNCELSTWNKICKIASSVSEALHPLTFDMRQWVDSSHLELIQALNSPHTQEVARVSTMPHEDISSRQQRD